jgi:TatD DNase family protein
MNLVDTHCHLDFPQFDADRAAAWARAQAAGVTLLINPGTDLPSSRRAVALAEGYPGIYAAVGVHPHDAATLGEAELAELRGLAMHPKVVAIGEIGLDYYRDLSPRPQQRAAFEAQLGLAADMGLPVVVHQREAAADVLAALRACLHLSVRHKWVGRPSPGSAPAPARTAGAVQAGGVLHAFSGDLAMAEEAVAWGFYIGIAGPLTFANARQLPEVVGWAPADRLLLETDAPYLAPHPHRGQRNEPAYLRLTAGRLADLRGLSPDAVALQTTDNARRLFRLDTNHG